VKAGIRSPWTPLFFITSIAFTVLYLYRGKIIVLGKLLPFTDPPVATPITPQSNPPLMNDWLQEQ